MWERSYTPSATYHLPDVFLRSPRRLPHHGIGNQIHIAFHDCLRDVPHQFVHARLASIDRPLENHLHRLLLLRRTLRAGRRLR